MGTSFGAKTALWLALQRPERVRGLVLEAPAAIRQPGAQSPAGTPEEIARRLYAHPERLGNIPLPDPATRAKTQPLVQRLRGPDRDPELESRLPGLTVPTLVLFGTLDQVISPAMGRVYKDLIPGCHLVFVYDAGARDQHRSPRGVHRSGGRLPRASRGLRDQPRADGDSPLGRTRSVRSAVRCGRRGRWVRGTLHALPSAQARPLGARLRGGPGRRRHLVLEPLPGRALRRREHGLLVLVLGGAPAGVALDRAVLRAARDLEVHQPRRRPVRSAPRHPARDARDQRRLRRGDQPVDRRDRPRRPRVGAVLHHGHGLPLHDAGAEVQGPRVASADPGITPGAGPTRASISPASASRSSAPDRPRSSRSRSSRSRPRISTCSSGRRTTACRRTTRRSTRTTSAA